MFYVISPWYRTGGPEALHQLCDALGGNMFYEDSNSDVVLFPEYTNITIVKEIPDSKDTVIIVPEYKDISEFCLKYPLSKIVLWWLAFDSRHLESHKKQKVIHAYQSEYARRMVQEDGIMLSDYTNFVEPPPQKKVYRIAYNPKKDNITPRVFNGCVPLINMTKEMMIDTLSKCEIYIDLGYHPGKDRIPREAALCDCIVITNMAGSAENPIDVPIREKADSIEKLHHLVNTIHESDQSAYREIVRNEKATFFEQVEQLKKRVQED
jgi:hypothetical protein